MSIRVLQSGQSLIEILFALSVFIIGVSTIGYLALDAFSSALKVADRTQARLLAAEGIEALATIRDKDFSAVTAGTYGLGVEEGFWVLAPEPDQSGKFTRTITITDRDEDTSEVAAAVTWNASGGQVMQVSYNSLISNWRQTNGQASNLVVNTDNVSVIASSTELIGLFLKNDGSEDLVITALRLFWNTPAQLERFMISGVELFAASTSQPVSSGTNIAVSNYVLTPYSGFQYVSALQFDGSVAASNFVIIFTFEDGSTRSVSIWPT